ASYPTKPLVSFRTYRQLSGWNLPPLVIRAYRAHCQQRTYATQQTVPLFDDLVGASEQRQRNGSAWRTQSITLSARTKSEGGTSRRSAFAVLRLIKSSSLVGACTGRLAGVSP